MKKCIVCSKQYKNIAKLVNSNPNSPQWCFVCNKGFNDRDQMTEHAEDTDCWLVSDRVNSVFTQKGHYRLCHFHTEELVICLQ